MKQPYFEIQKEGWGTGWRKGETINLDLTDWIKNNIEENMTKEINSNIKTEGIEKFP